jgi:hypothetical protein
MMNDSPSFAPCPLERCLPPLMVAFPVPPMMLTLAIGTLAAMVGMIWAVKAGPLKGLLGPSGVVLHRPTTLRHRQQRQRLQQGPLTAGIASCSHQSVWQGVKQQPLTTENTTHQALVKRLKQQGYIGHGLPSVASSALREPALQDPLSFSARFFNDSPTPQSTLETVWRYFWGLERRLLLEATRGEWGALVVEVYYLRQQFGHEEAFETASRALLETAALLRMSQSLRLPLEKLTEAHLLQWEERLLFQGLLPAKRFRLRRQQLVNSGFYQSANPGMGPLAVHGALAGGVALPAAFVHQAASSAFPLPAALSLRRNG